MGEGGKVRLSEVGVCGLLLTEYHPVRVGGEWVFPRDVDGANTRERHCEFVYNLVLAQGHVVQVDGIECCTLGHGMKDNVVIEHAYFGTQRVVQDLSKQAGWRTGLVVLQSGAVKRDAESNLVNGMV